MVLQDFVTQPRGRIGLGAPTPLTIKEIVDLFEAREFDADGPLAGMLRLVYQTLMPYRSWKLPGW